MINKSTVRLFLATIPLLWAVQYVEGQQKPAMPAVFTELPDPAKVDLQAWKQVKPGLQASFVTIDKRFAKSEVPQITRATQQELVGWKGERLSAQLLLWSNSQQDQVKVEIGSFKSAQGNSLPASIASAHFLRYVMTDEFAGGCGHRKPEDFAASLSPDMLDDLTSYTMDANTARPVWIKVAIPKTAKAGKYTAQVKVNGKGQPAQTFQLQVEVIDQVLPDAKQWTYHLDQWQHPSAVARVEGVEMWSDAHFKAMKPVMKMLADAGQKVITATVNKDPWNIQTYDPYADMITWTQEADGSWRYDYTVFDKWVQFMMDLGVDKMLNCYSIIPWNNEIHYTDANNGQLVNVEAKPGSEQFKTLWTPFLKDFVKHLKAKGWLEITNIAIDEREREQMDAALALLQQVAPELGVSYADNQKTYQRYPNSDDISISAQHPFSHEDLVDRKARGLNTTFYICCSDAFPNQFTFSDPAESTYLAWYALASDFDGMLRWAFNSWVENPLTDSRFRTWPAGDTYIVYPKAKSSIRYERMVEGVQDYEKVQLVRKALQAKNDTASLAKLDAAIAKLKVVTRTSTWNSYLNEAKALLNALSKTI